MIFLLPPLVHCRDSDQRLTLQEVLDAEHCFMAVKIGIAASSMANPASSSYNASSVATEASSYEHS